MENRAKGARGCKRAAGRLTALGVLLAILAGCAREATMLPVAQRRAIDRKYVEYPSGSALTPLVKDLTGPTAIAFDAEGVLFVAEGGTAGADVRLTGFRADGTKQVVYPIEQHIPLLGRGFRVYGPVGGMVVDQGRIYVSHRDERGRGMITAFGYDGSHTTVVADLPAQGDFGITDLAVAPNGRLFFGVGAATNSGVVGLDNWDWVKDHPDFADAPQVDLKLLGYRFDTRNPRAGLFGGDDIAVTAPFQPFGKSTRTRIGKARNDRPTAAVYSVDPAGGGLKVEAHGVRYPRGLAFNEYGNLYMTNEGMELRGTRPVKDDPDALLRVIMGTWYGWPDFSADLYPISDGRFQPGAEMIIKSGYPDLGYLIDHESSGLLRPDRTLLVRGVFSPLSGAAKLDFAPGRGALKEFHGNAMVALSGDRAPFATSGRPLVGSIGRKVVRVDVDNQQVRDFVYNTRGIPLSAMTDRPEYALERPVDVKFGPDGSMYILDFGQMTMRGGTMTVKEHTGMVYRLMSAGEVSTTEPAPEAIAPPVE